MKNSLVKKAQGKKERRNRGTEEGKKGGEKREKEERFKELGLFGLEKRQLIGQFSQVRCLVQCMAQSETLYLCQMCNIKLREVVLMEVLAVLGTHRKLREHFLLREERFW